MSGKLLVAEIKQCFRIKVWASINTSLSKFLNVFNSTAKIDARRVRLYLFNCLLLSSQIYWNTQHTTHCACISPGCLWCYSQWKQASLSKTLSSKVWTWIYLVTMRILKQIALNCSIWCHWLIMIDSVITMQM